YVLLWHGAVDQVGSGHLRCARVGAEYVDAVPASVDGYQPRPLTELLVEQLTAAQRGDRVAPVLQDENIGRARGVDPHRWFRRPELPVGAGRDVGRRRPVERVLLAVLGDGAAVGLNVLGPFDGVAGHGEKDRPAGRKG